jgi:hypothetical protein
MRFDAETVAAIVVIAQGEYEIRPYEKIADAG